MTEGWPQSDKENDNERITRTSGDGEKRGRMLRSTFGRLTKRRGISLDHA
jgi:hypothetical protein